MSAAQWISASKLKRWERNPRGNQPVQEVAASIRNLGWGSVILARKDGTIVAGDTRFQAHQLLLKQASQADTKDWHPDAVRAVTHNVVPVRTGDWDDREAIALSIADNRLQEMATWEGLDELARGMTLSDLNLCGLDASSLSTLSSSTQEVQVEAAPDESPLAYKVIVTCDDEEGQTRLMDELESKGYRCHPLIS